MKRLMLSITLLGVAIKLSPMTVQKQKEFLGQIEEFLNQQLEKTKNSYNTSIEDIKKERARLKARKQDINTKQALEVLNDMEKMIHDEYRKLLADLYNKKKPDA